LGPFLYGGGDYEKILGMYRRYWQQFSKYWGYFILVTIGSSFIIGQVVIPGLTWLVQKMMELANIPYLSYTNIVSVILGHPVVAVGLLIILIITLLAAYLQFTIWMAIVANIRAQQNVSIWQLIVERIKDLRRVRFTTMLVTIAYLIVVVPFSKTIFQSELLSKITIPVFILDDMWNSATIWVPIVTFTLLAVFLSIRLITFLPGTINRHETTFEVIVDSWRETKGHFFKIAVKLFASSFLLGLIGAVSRGILYVVQTLLDQHLPAIALGGAVINLMLLEIINQILMVMGVVFIVNIALDEFQGSIVSKSAQTNGVVRFKKLKRSLAVVLVVVIGGAAGVYNFAYFKGALIDPPLVIAHRGVDDQNGVQNTIPALEKTAKEKPDFVEMDIHETKDHQFVVIHDGNLKNLAGVNKKVHDLTLAQLTQLTVSENDQSAKIPSFNDYLAAAEKNHQKLLVEIKTSNEDSPEMVSNFLKLYQKRMLADGNYMHSLSYPVITKVKKQEPQLFSSFILPYNLAFPRTQANAYTMEETTLTQAFMDQAHKRNK
jgi:glycerophosphoryl diester phosphodiesterase